MSNLNGFSYTSLNNLSSFANLSDIQANKFVALYNGSSVSPSFTWSSNLKSGLYMVGDNKSIGVSVDGFESLKITGSTIETLNDLYANSFKFVTDNDTGIYSNEANTVSVSTGGLQTLKIDSNGLKTIAGNPSYPSISFLDGSTTGFYLPGGNSIGISTGGASRVIIDTGYLNSNLPILVPHGSVSAPSYSFNGYSNTGLYIISGSTLGITAGGVQSAIFTGSQVKFKDGSLAFPSISFISDFKTGFFRTATGQFAITCNGSYLCSFNSGYLEMNQPLRLIGGNAFTPGLSFITDTDTGIYSNTSNTISVTTGGTSRMTISNTIDTTTPIRITGSVSNYLTIGTTDVTYRQSNDGPINSQVLQIGGSGGLGYLGVDHIVNDTYTGLNFNVMNTNNQIIQTAIIMGNYTLDPTVSRIAGSELGNMVFALRTTDGYIKECVRMTTNGSTSVQTQFIDGTNALPSISFKNNNNMGLYRPAADTIGIVTAGIERFRISNTGIFPGTPYNLDIGSSSLYWRDGYIQRILLATGSSPTLTFNGDEDTGIGQGSPNTINLVTSGFTRLFISDTYISPNVPITVPVGSAAAPSYTFSPNTNTGLFWGGSDTIGFTTGGTSRLSISTTGLTSTLQIIGPNGSAVSPGFRCTSEATGFSVPSAGTLAFSVAGSSQVNINSARVATGIPIYTADGTAAAPSYTFSADTNTGIYRVSNDILGITAGGQSYSFGNGYFCQGDDAQSNLGLSTHRWIAVYAQNGTIQTSDQNEKKDIENSPLGIDFVNKLTPRRYKWINGTSGRFHYGLVAQELKVALDDAKIDTKDFAGFVDSSKTESPDKPAKLGINYADIVTILIQSVKDLSKRLDDATARIAALEII